MGLLSTILAGASVAANHAVFNDRINDGTTGFAPDVSSLEVTSADNGDVAFKVGLNEPGGTFYIGDLVRVYIDNDMNANDGISGFDTVLQAQGVRDSPTSGHVNYDLCNFQNANTFNCERFADGIVTNARTGTDSHAVTFPVTTPNWFTIRIVVFGDYADPDNPNDTTRQGHDQAPDSGAYSYDVRADADNDGVAGSADACPRFPGGKFDKDGDGCAPKYPIPNFTFAAGPSGNGLFFSRIAVTNAPAGATVTARIGGVTVHRRGPGALPGVNGRRLGVGTTITFIYTSPSYFGRYKVARVTSRNVVPIKSGCTPPGKVAPLIPNCKVTG